MVSFEIWVNGKREYTVGSEEAEVFGVDLSFHPNVTNSIPMLEATGYSETGEAKYADELKWGMKGLNLGDEVVIKVVNTEKPDEPSRTRYEVGLVPETHAHAMLCANCGKSQFDVASFVRTSRIALCNECLSALADISTDEGET